MDEYRKKIDQIDNSIFNLLEERYTNIIQIALYKKENNICILDKTRENKIFDNIEKLCIDKNEKEYIKLIYKYILNISKTIQN